MTTRAWATKSFIAILVCLSMLLVAAAARAAPQAVVTVNTTSLVVDGNTSSIAALQADPGNDGVISFPEALTALNFSGAGNTLNFNLAPGSIINYNTTYYLYAGSTVIDGDVNGDGIPDVALDGPDTTYHSLVVYSDNNILRNLVITGVGLDGSGAHDNQIVNCYIGTYFDGVSPYPGKAVNGIEIEYGAYNNIVGGNTAAERNLIAGNGTSTGILIHSDAHDNQVIGNYIGVGLNGQALPNGIGVFVDTAAVNNTIGGDRSGTACDGPCNIIGGNNTAGVVLSDSQSTGNVIKGNYIGLDPSGNRLGSHSNAGVIIQDNTTGNTVGGDRSSSACNGPCNAISGNSGAGILFTTGAVTNTVKGNYIGINLAGSVPISNTLSGVIVRDGSSGNTIGGQRAGVSNTCEGSCNLIAGNGQSGVIIAEAGTDNNTISGNFIGVGLDGVTDLGNGGSGVAIIDQFGAVSTQPSLSSEGSDLATSRLIGIDYEAGPAVRIQAGELVPMKAGASQLRTQPLVIEILGAPKAPAGIAPNNNIIGGVKPNFFACAGPCNLIGGNGGSGVQLSGAGVENNLVQGNYIGHELNPNGSTPVPNVYSGVDILNGASKNTIGGDDFDCQSRCNVLSGNLSSGIYIYGSGTISNVVQGNFIGISASGNFLMPNTYNGVEIADGASRNQVGGALSSIICDGPCNTIAGNTQSGVILYGTGTVSNTVQGNDIGRVSITPVPNGNIAIYVAYDATGNTIGGANQGEGNDIYGGVVVLGTTRARILGNKIEIPSSWAWGDLLPLDLSFDGPSCNPWVGGSGDNNGIAPARILNMTSSFVEGQTQPGYLVEAYKVSALGNGGGRYFARSFEPVGHVSADASGHYVINVPVGKLSSGDQVAVTATDPAGNTSELSQLKRPAIFVHGIGGSWIKSSPASDWLWLPPLVPFADSLINNRLARMALDVAGNSLEPVYIDGMVEFGGWAIYGPVMDWLVNQGYSRNPSVPLNRDLYDYAYDWRLALAPSAAGLRALVTQVTDLADTNIAKSCETDIVAHSMGGMVASLYVRANPVHSQDRVHRLITMGTPYLGTPQAAKGHTKGYVFELEKNLPFSPDWGRMLQMARNLTAAYTLMPSLTYWNATSSPAYLEDLYGFSLGSYASTFAFMTDPKVDAAGNPRGLERNAGLWSGEQVSVHDQIDDWRTWNGPPQIFRVVGDNVRTAVGWDARSWLMLQLMRNCASPGLITEVGDTCRHRAYRSSLVDIPGNGDGTVALASARLGRGAGGTDYSGVDESIWIEEFIAYSLDHLSLVTDNTSLARMTDILKAGYLVSSTSPNPLQASKDAPQALPENDFYLLSTAPLGVHVLDSLGNHTGPYTPTLYTGIEYKVPGIQYEANDFAFSLSLPQSDTYTLTVLAPVENATILATRVHKDASGNRENVLFSETSVAINGGLQMVLDSAGTLLTAPFSLDANGDSVYESTLDATTSLTSTLSGLVIPEPYPWLLSASAIVTDTYSKVVTLTVPTSGGLGWQWQVSASDAWIQPTHLSGMTPQAITVTLDSPSLAVGVFTGTLTTTLSYNGFQVSYPLAVRLEVKPGGPTALTITELRAEAGNMVSKPVLWLVVTGLLVVIAGAQAARYKKKANGVR